MKEIKKTKGNVTTIKTIDDGKLIKLDIESKDPEDLYHFIANYEYDLLGLLYHYYDNNLVDIKYDYDSKNRVEWKRKTVGMASHIYHYFYNKETENIIKAEHLLNDDEFVVTEFTYNGDMTVCLVVIEYDNFNNIIDIIYYCKENDIEYRIERVNGTNNMKFISKLNGEDIIDDIKFLLELSNVKGVD